MQIATQLRRTEIREIMKRHPGSITKVATSLDPPVSTQAVSLWLKGNTKSARISEALQLKALDLLAEERTKNGFGGTQ